MHKDTVLENPCSDCLSVYKQGHGGSFHPLHVRMSLKGESAELLLLSLDQYDGRRVRRAILFS